MKTYQIQVQESIPGLRFSFLCFIFMLTPPGTFNLAKNAIFELKRGRNALQIEVMTSGDLKVNENVLAYIDK